MCHSSEEYHELSAAEEEDLETLLSRDNAIQDAAAFTEHLSEELAHLDQVHLFLALHSTGHTCLSSPG